MSLSKGMGTTRDDVDDSNTMKDETATTSEAIIQEEETTTPTKSRRNAGATMKHRRMNSFSIRPTMPLGGGGGGSNNANKKFKPATDIADVVVKTTSTLDDDDNNDFDYTIRKMKMKDIYTVYNIGNIIFTATEYPNLYRTWDDYTVVENYEHSPEFCFVATITNTNIIIGFLLGQVMTKVQVGTRGYIEWVAVLQQYRRHGVATKLIQNYINITKQYNINILIADTQADNIPAINLLSKSSLSNKSDHVYLTRQLPKNSIHIIKHVDLDDGTVDFTYTATTMNKKNGINYNDNDIKTKQSSSKKIKINIRNMEIQDLYKIYLIGEQIFTSKNINLYNFWDEHLIMNSFLSDSEYCIVATTTITKDDNDENNGKDEEEEEQVIGFAFGTTIEKPRSSWKYGYLVWLGCAVNWQGIGLASQLYNVMVELFIKDKCRIIMIDTQQNNEAALQFFQRKGFGNNEEHVYLSNHPTTIANHISINNNTTDNTKDNDNNYSNNDNNKNDD